MIPDEAMEAAHRAWREQAAVEGSIFEYNLRAAIEAAAPHLKAAALREAADAFEDLPVNKGPEISSGTWDWFELFPIAHLRERADRMTQRPE